MDQDMLVAEVRDARHEISAECNHDLWKLCQRYQKLQRELRDSGRYGILQAPCTRKFEDSNSTAVAR